MPLNANMKQHKVLLNSAFTALSAFTAGGKLWLVCVNFQALFGKVPSSAALQEVLKPLWESLANPKGHK